MKPALDGLAYETVSDAAGRRAEASLVPTFEGRELDAKDLPEIQAEIRFIGDMQRLQIKPGDVFVLSVDIDDLSESTVKHLQEVVRRELGDVKVLVLAKGLTLGVLGVSDEPMTISAGEAKLIEQTDWTSIEVMTSAVGPADTSSKAAGGISFTVDTWKGTVDTWKGRY